MARETNFVVHIRWFQLLAFHQLHGFTNTTSVKSVFRDHRFVSVEVNI
jgi:hypothetical protein